MSKWLNNEYILYKATLEKPCKKLGYCPYGQLVEEFPLYTKQKKYAIKHNKYTKFIYGKGWEKCKKEDVGAMPNINWASERVKNPYACETFRHDCPVYYMAKMGGIELEQHKLKKQLKKARESQVTRK